MNQWRWLLLVSIQTLDIDLSLHSWHTKFADKILNSQMFLDCMYPVMQMSSLPYLNQCFTLTGIIYMLFTYLRVANAQPTSAELLLTVGSLVSIPLLLDLLFLLNINMCKPEGCYYLHILQVLLFLHDLAVGWVEISS